MLCWHVSIDTLQDDTAQWLIKSEKEPRFLEESKLPVPGDRCILWDCFSGRERFRGTLEECKDFAEKHTKQPVCRVRCSLTEEFLLGIGAVKTEENLYRLYGDHWNYILLEYKSGEWYCSIKMSDTQSPSLLVKSFSDIISHALTDAWEIGKEDKTNEIKKVLGL